MDDTLTSEELLKIEEFAKGLRECYENFRKQHENDPDNFAKIVIDYAIKTLDIHLDLAQLKFDRWNNEVANASKD